METNTLNKKVVIRENFATGNLPSYFTGSGTPNVSSLPNNKYYQNSSEFGGTSSVTSAFDITPDDYKSITLEYNDVMLSNKSDVTARFGLVPPTGETLNFNAAFSFRGGTLSIICFVNGVNMEGVFHNNFDFEKPHDFKIYVDIKRGFVDFIVEGSRVRYKGITLFNQIMVEFSRLSSQDGRVKTLSFKEFSLTLE